ncbi:hypothetical protein AQ490_25375 [Wenjunlia vitaminophila]|uniref:Toxin-antitoxin system HicB family antitoxin n=1 Tax=Wenjunlia vitaminophila TaxID=76728 RepID=A0A0T6LQE1_WENVI|nr:toxin-antitoxin system HicB family antitoxin [Wenjunlia vitaminophila]KRV48346.1 hypothetical protein AQ490_25375 [Wenjunlia vitaminophila]
MEQKSLTLRVPKDDAERISRRAAELGLSVNAYMHQTVMADVNQEVARFAAPTREILDWLGGDPEAADVLDRLNADIDPRPKAQQRGAAA